MPINVSTTNNNIVNNSNISIKKSRNGPNKKNESNKLKFLLGYLSTNDDVKSKNNTNIVDYFNKYQAFCFDLCLDSVLKGDLKFTYK